MNTSPCAKQEKQNQKHEFGLSDVTANKDSEAEESKSLDNNKMLDDQDERMLVDDQISELNELAKGSDSSNNLVDNHGNIGRSDSSDLQNACSDLEEELPGTGCDTTDKQESTVDQNVELNIEAIDNAEEKSLALGVVAAEPLLTNSRPLLTNSQHDTTNAGANDIGVQEPTVLICDNSHSAKESQVAVENDQAEAIKSGKKQEDPLSGNHSPRNMTKVPSSPDTVRKRKAVDIEDSVLTGQTLLH